MKRKIAAYLPLFLCLTSCSGTLSRWNPWRYDNAEKYVAGNTTYDVSKTILVDWSEGNVYIEGKADVESIKIIEEATTYTDSRYLVHTYLDSKNKLHVKPGQSGMFSLEDTDQDFQTFKKTLHIEVPLNYKFKKIECNTLGTNFFISDVNVEDIYTTNTNGGTHLTRVKADKASINTWTSSIKINESSFDDLQTKTTYGSAEINLNNMPTKIWCTSKTGNADLIIPENDGFVTSKSAKIIATNFECEKTFEDEESNKYTLTYKNGGNSKITWSTATGTMRITIK